MTDQRLYPVLLSERALFTILVFAVSPLVFFDFFCYIFFFRRSMNIFFCLRLLLIYPAYATSFIRISNVDEVRASLLVNYVQTRDLFWSLTIRENLRDHGIFEHLTYTVTKYFITQRVNSS